MKGSNRIDYRPYVPLIQRGEPECPYICRLAPYETGFELEWLGDRPGVNYVLWYGLKDEADKCSIRLNGRLVRVDQLQKDCDYEFFIQGTDGRASCLRYVRTGAIPEGCGVVNYLHPEDTQYDCSGRYLCSPSLTRTKSGRLIAGMDVFGHATSQNLTLLFYSDDDGASWRYLTDIYPFFWSSLFYQRDVLYLLGVTTEYGNLQIACSLDEGQTWSAPVTLFYGSNRMCPYGGVHRAPMQVVSYQGRLYTSMEYGNWLTLGYHAPAVLSVDEDADLMCPENWSLSRFLKFEGRWKEMAGERGDGIEGNIVPGTDGKLYNLMRWKLGSMLLLRVNTEDPDAELEFVDIIDAPVSNSMFKVFWTGDRYLMITSRKSEEAAKWKSGIYRSVLSICEGEDFWHFRVVKDVIDAGRKNPERYGFQYPAYLYENNMLYLTIRSSFNRARAAHDSNYILFSKVPLD